MAVAEHLEEGRGICKTSRLTGVSKTGVTSLTVRSRVVVSLVIGKRERERLEEVVSDFAERIGGPPPALTMTDD